MTFPLTQPLADDFQRANGALGANWVNPLATYGDLTISGNAVTSNVVVGTNAAAAWKTPVARATSVFCQVPVLPLTADFILVGFVNNTTVVTQNVYAAVIIGVPTNISIASDNGGSIGAGANITFNAGDWIGLRIDPVTLTCTSYTKAAAAAAWTPQTSGSGSVISARALTGWYPFMMCADTTTRITNFGFEQAPSGVASPVFGHGAC